MAKKKTRKKASMTTTTAKPAKKTVKKGRPRTGQRRGAGREMKAINLKLPVDLLDWIDEQADVLGYSRTMTIEKYLQGSRDAGEKIEESSLFDDLKEKIEDMAQQAIRDASKR